MSVSKGIISINNALETISFTFDISERDTEKDTEKDEDKKNNEKSRRRQYYILILIYNHSTNKIISSFEYNLLKKDDSSNKFEIIDDKFSTSSQATSQTKLKVEKIQEKEIVKLTINNKLLSFVDAQDIYSQLLIKKTFL
jgi:hypothetical protein